MCNLCAHTQNLEIHELKVRTPVSKYELKAHEKNNSVLEYHEI